MSATSPAPDQPLLRDAAVIVDTSVSLTLGTDSLLVVGKDCAWPGPFRITDHAHR